VGARKTLITNPVGARLSTGKTDVALFTRIRHTIAAGGRYRHASATLAGASLGAARCARVSAGLPRIRYAVAASGAQEDLLDPYGQGLGELALSVESGGEKIN
jgi:hypothetical protein